jgi:hypothetical protein
MLTTDQKITLAGALHDELEKRSITVVRGPDLIDSVRPSGECLMIQAKLAMPDYGFTADVVHGIDRSDLMTSDSLSKISVGIAVAWEEAIVQQLGD